jgi:hypothetical protein
VTFDRTIAELDQLLQADAARKERSLGLLRSVVRNLDGGLLPPDEEPMVAGDGRPQRRGVMPAARPFVPMPKRTTHGGRFGPAVVAKLRERALR